MPGPGPHIIHTLTTGIGLHRLTHGRLSPHHCIFYSLNAFLGPDLGSFAEWITSSLLGLDGGFGDLAMTLVPLNRKQCLLLLASGPLSHFFLDHLFEENGHSSTYTRILSTGWWDGRAPVNPDAVVVIGLLCTSLLGRFIYINRVKQGESIITQSNKSLVLILSIACLYCLWCASQIYWRHPPQPAIGEEADLGVVDFTFT